MRILAKVLLFFGVTTLSLAYPNGRRLDIFPVEDKDLKKDDHAGSIDFDELNPKDRELEELDELKHKNFDELYPEYKLDELRYKGDSDTDDFLNYIGRHKLGESDRNDAGDKLYKELLEKYHKDVSDGADDNVGGGNDDIFGDDVKDDEDDGVDGVDEDDEILKYVNDRNAEEEGELDDEFLKHEGKEFDADEFLKDLDDRNANGEGEFDDDEFLKYMEDRNANGEGEFDDDEFLKYMEDRNANGEGEFDDDEFWREYMNDRNAEEEGEIVPEGDAEGPEDDFNKWETDDTEKEDDDVEDRNAAADDGGAIDEHSNYETGLNYDGHGKDDMGHDQMTSLNDVANDQYDPMKQLDRVYYDAYGPPFARNQLKTPFGQAMPMQNHYDNFHTENLAGGQPGNEFDHAMPLQSYYDTVKTMDGVPVGYEFDRAAPFPGGPSPHHHHHHHHHHYDGNGDPTSNYAQMMPDRSYPFDQDRSMQNQFGSPYRPINRYNTGKRLLSIDNDEKPMTPALSYGKFASEDRNQPLSPQLLGEVAKKYQNMIKDQPPEMLKLARNGGFDF